MSDGSIAITATATTGSLATLQATPIAPRLVGRTFHEFKNEYAFAALKDDGSVVTWGRSDSGGDSSSVSSQLSSGVSQIFSTNLAFAALKDDGSVVTWGDSDWGGDSSGVSDQLSSGVIQIFSTASAFAALKDDGSVVNWGNYHTGGAIAIFPSSNLMLFRLIQFVKLSLLLRMTARSSVGGYKLR